MRPSLLDRSPEQLVLEVGCTLSEARRALSHLISHGNRDLEGMKRPLSKTLRAHLLDTYSLERPKVLRTVEDTVDRSVRTLFELHDGQVVEAVRIPLAKPGHFSVCLSSQVGCAMRCDFCATGRLGLTRSLEAWEMVGCWLQIRDEAPGRVTGAVFMGQGEPFHNYDAVIRAAQRLSAPDGGRIPAKSITISTVGLVPQIRRYTREDQPYRLIVSLSSALQEERRALMPVAGKWKVQELMDALRERHARTGRRVTLAWVMMAGVNDTPEQLEALRALIRDTPVRINLIDVNDPREGGYSRLDAEALERFRDGLSTLGVPIVRRYSVGAESNSACGMLAAQH